MRWNNAMNEYDSDSDLYWCEKTGASSPMIRMSETVSSPNRHLVRSFSFHNIYEFMNTKGGRKCLRKNGSIPPSKNIDFNTSKNWTVTIDQWGTGSDRDCSDPKITKKVEDAMEVLKKISNTVTIK